MTEKTGSTLKWKVDSDKAIVAYSLERRGWIQTEGDDWNFYWVKVSNLKPIFSSENGFRLNDNQLVNHFPNHDELSRKDLMVKNLKRYRKDLERDGLSKDVVDFVPTTFSLPAEYSLFVEEFRKCPNSMWIMKPTNQAQGKGIFIVNRLGQVKRWCTMTLAADPQTQPRPSYIISKYIVNPLLIGGRKFDLRIYVLVTNYRPLMVYIYQEGFARFSTAKYSNDVKEMGNPFVHLTNVSVQRHAEEYNAQHGGKWRLSKLKLFLESTRGKDPTEKLFAAIENIIIHSLRAVQRVLINDKHSFECYGYDIIIDEDLKPWLVEVNSSPSLSFTTQGDKMLKLSLLRDILDIVVPSDDIIDARKRRGMHAATPIAMSRTNAFQILVDESVSLLAKSNQNAKTGVGRARPSVAWR